MSSTAKTEAATFRSRYTLTPFIRTRLCALTESRMVPHRSPTSRMRWRKTTQTGQKWFAEHQQNNDADAAQTSE